MRFVRTAILAFGLGIYSSPAAAAPILIDFEGLSDLDLVTTEFAALGLVFSGATVLQSGAVGGSLNELDFPPFSGVTAVFDSSADGIRIDFVNGATSVSGRFTYGLPVTMTAFSGATVVGSATSQFGENTALGPNPANELLSLSFLDPITHVVLSTDGFGGGTFVLDDFFADTVDTVAGVPEPGTAALLLLGAALAAGARSRRQTRAVRS
jgi:hypothetical protein